MISGRTDDLNRLASGSDQLADGLSTLRDQIAKLMSGVGSLINALASIQKQFGGDKTFGQMGDADRLISSMRALGDTLQV